MQQETELGLTLQEALERYSEPDAWKLHEELKVYFSPLFFLDVSKTWEEIQNDRFHAVRTELQQELVAKLTRGELLATAYKFPLSPDGKRVPIEPTLWEQFDDGPFQTIQGCVDFERSMVRRHGLELVDIRILPTNVKSSGGH